MTLGRVRGLHDEVGLFFSSPSSMPPRPRRVSKAKAINNVAEDAQEGSSGLTAPLPSRPSNAHVRRSHVPVSAI
jgi:hypothetical protein